MPTYEYVCEKCGAEFDIFQSMSAEALKVCPKEKCAMKRWGKGRVKKKISSGAGLIFKGTGFYITDYRSENYKAGAKKDSGGGAGDSKPAGSGSSSATTAGGDSKPAAKPESKPAKPAKAK